MDGHLRRRSRQSRPKSSGARWRLRSRRHRHQNPAKNEGWRLLQLLQGQMAFRKLAQKYSRIGHPQRKRSATRRRLRSPPPPPKIGVFHPAPTSHKGVHPEQSNELFFPLPGLGDLRSAFLETRLSFPSSKIFSLLLSSHAMRVTARKSCLKEMRVLFPRRRIEDRRGQGEGKRARYFARDERPCGWSAQGGRRLFLEGAEGFVGGAELPSVFVEDDRYGNIFEQVFEMPFVLEGVEEGAILHFLQDFDGDASGYVDATERQNF